MKQYYWRIVFLLSALQGLLGGLTPASAQSLSNLAAYSSSVTASVNVSGHAVSLIYDNRTNAGSYWSSNHGEAFYGQYEYVEFRWPQNNEFTEIRAYWAVNADEDVLLPDDAYLAWWDGHNWQKGETLAEADGSNLSTTTLSSRVSNRVRLYLKSEKACGIREVKLFGYKGETCTPAVLTGRKAYAWDADVAQTLSVEVTLPEGEEEEPIWNWTFPDGSTATTATVQTTVSGIYTVIYQRQCGAETEFSIKVFDPSESYVWPEYNPTLNYDFRWEYPKLDPPSKGMLPENVGMVGHATGEWWACGWGSQRKNNKYITDLAIENLLKKMDEDFAYFRDEFGWPPDKRARNGYYSTVYIYGSGIQGNNDYKALGGWQSATNYRGESWPMVYISYYPIACFDPSFKRDDYRNITVTDAEAQQNACVHEGIHATFADLEGCRNSAWFHEGGNTWLQGEAELAKSGKDPESMGWLSAGNMIAPFMPIECYSGWLLDDSFGGPSAEGVNMYNGSQQVCTWRKLLGGVQYGELFPHFLSEIMGRGSIPWIWRYCKSRLLEGMADSLGSSQMRHLILEYRARQAMIDVGQWSKACKKLLNDNWLASIQQEWSPYWKKVNEWKATPYANMYRCNEVDSAGWWYPEWRTTPGWSGANQIPLHVSGNVGDVVSLHFKPLGENMVCMLCYRTKAGHIYYSQPVEGEGDVLMKLVEKPANGVVIAVVVNTDYIYKGEETRKKHFDYRLRMDENIYQPAKAQLKWYEYAQTIRDTEFISGIEDASETDGAARFTLEPTRTVVARGESLPLHMTAVSHWQVPVQLFSQTGQLVYQQSFLHDGDFKIPADIVPGLYILQASDGQEKSSVKIVVK
ncbi:MAG: T9SS type A sorting domain-containing protein [Prevotella sp.]|nr:T9SS type A sorting domain-containing protein [Prevotella sp.]